MAETSPNVAIYHPRAEDYQYFTSDDGTIHLELTDRVYFTLASPRLFNKSDLAAEDAAMRKLAEVATGLAAKLEQRATEAKSAAREIRQGGGM